MPESIIINIGKITAIIPLNQLGVAKYLNFFMISLLVLVNTFLNTFIFYDLHLHYYQGHKLTQEAEQE